MTKVLMVSKSTLLLTIFLGGRQSMNYYDDVQKLSEESVRRIRKFIEEKKASAK